MPIKMKRSAVAAKVPTTAQLELGELAVNTRDGKIYLKTDDGAGGVAVQEFRNWADLSTALAGKSDTGHGHVIGDVTGLQTALDGKAASGHTHAGVYCPSSDNLGQLSVLSFGGSGSSLIEVMRFQFGGASAA